MTTESNMKAGLDIRPEHLEIVKAILKQHLSSEIKVWAYGSRAKWQAKDHSDLDLMLEHPQGEKIDFKTLARLQSDFEESDLPWKVDVSDWAGISEEFKTLVELDKKSIGFEVVETSPIGDLPPGWTVEALNNLTTKIGSGSTPRGGESAYLEKRKEYAFVRSQNVFDYYFSAEGLKFISDKDAKKLKGVSLEQGDILLNITGDGVTFARSCIVPKEILPAAVNQHVSIIRVEPQKCMPGYLLAYLCLPAIKEYIANFNAGGSRRAITKGHIESFEVPLAPKHIQLFVHKLVFDLMEKQQVNRQINQTLEQIAQALFKSWFVDFEPTRAKIEAKQNGQDPERTAMAAIAGKALDQLDSLPPETLKQLKTTAALFPDALEDSELGEIPEGWEVTTLGEHFNVTMGQSPRGDTYNEDGEGIVFFQGRKDFGFRFPTPRVYTTAPKRFAEPGDTLISVRAPVGDRNMADERCCLGRGVAGIRHLSKAVSYTYAYIGHIESSLQASGSDGTVFSSINKKELCAIEYVAPPASLVAEFEKKMKPIDQRVDVSAKEIKSLTTLRDSLLPKLLSGELSINIPKESGSAD